MTKSLILKLSDERLDDWVRLLNVGSRKKQVDAQLSVFDVRRIIRLGLADTGNMYLETVGGVATATARLDIINGARALLSDFKTLPGHSEAGYALLNHLLMVCRKAGLLSVAAWVSQKEARLPDMLASYTFVPRYIRTRMRLLLMASPEDFEFDSTYVVEEDDRIQQVAVLRWGLGPRAHGEGLIELRNTLESRWKPALTVRLKEQHEPFLIGCVSESDRKQGWLQVKESLTQHSIQSWPSVEVLKHVLRLMYDRGVRSVVCETDASKRFQGSFTKLGFQTEALFFEFLLPLERDQSS